jgi:NitT/TauT family transport system ATP-binding protein
MVAERCPHPALALRDVAKRFDAVSALEGVTFDVAAGTFVSIVGPSGCGKSTLLHLIAGLSSPSAGRVEVFGEPLAGINRRATYMFQQDALLPWKTVLENIQLGLILRRQDPASGAGAGATMGWNGSA